MYPVAPVGRIFMRRSMAVSRASLSQKFSRAPLRLLVMLAVGVTMSGCGLVALPCRVSSAVVKVVPLVGHPAAAPLDACADIID
jgi:hypothetical protein